MSDADITKYLARYEAFIEQSARALRGYMNDRWVIFDADRYYSEKLLATLEPGDGTHMDDEKQRIFGGELARRVVPWICGPASRGRRERISLKR